jgi:hypothetical protein
VWQVVSAERDKQARSARPEAHRADEPQAAVPVLRLREACPVRTDTHKTARTSTHIHTSVDERKCKPQRDEEPYVGPHLLAHLLAWRRSW